MTEIYQKIVDFIRSLYNKNEGPVQLHEPHFMGNEKKYLDDCIDSKFVSSVGKYVYLFEQRISGITGAKYAIATVNGTAALHIALILSDVSSEDEVITQPLTFIATTNAIAYTGAQPVFVDVDKDTLGLSPEKLNHFLKKNVVYKDGESRNKLSGKRIRACVPMHTFGHPCKIDEIKEICENYGIFLVEDAAESIGSLYKNQHTGTFGNFGILSFNGNKIITTGGGGMILTNDAGKAKLAKHITTTAKVPHPWEYNHDMLGYNYRLINLSAALGCAQLEQLDNFLANKRELAQIYCDFFKEIGIKFVKEPDFSRSNYWLNAVILNNRQQRDDFLTYTNSKGIMTRPAWTLMTKLKMYEHCNRDNLDNSYWIEDRLVNIPSSVRY